MCGKVVKRHCYSCNSEVETTEKVSYLVQEGEVMKEYFPYGSCPRCGTDIAVLDRTAICKAEHEGRLIMQGMEG